MPVILIAGLLPLLTAGCYEPGPGVDLSSADSAAIAQTDDEPIGPIPPQFLPYSPLPNFGAEAPKDPNDPRDSESLVASMNADPNDRDVLDPNEMDQAEADYAAMFLARENVPVTLATGSSLPVGGPGVPVPGRHIIDRLCRLEACGETGWYYAEFLDEPNKPYEPPHYVLLNEYLEAIEHITELPDPPVLRLTGETTTYRDRHFILITEPPIVMRSQEFPADADRQIGEQSIDEPNAEAGDPNRDAEDIADTPDGRPDDVEDVSQMLLGEHIGRPMEIPGRVRVQDPNASGSVAPRVYEQMSNRMAYGADSLVIDRLVRVMPEGTDGWMLAVFESDNTLLHPPLRLLPCSRLQRAQVISALAMRRGARFRVSGLITHYHGRGYLLLGKIVRDREMGQFR